MYNGRGTYLSATEHSRIRHLTVKKTNPYCLHITSADNFGKVLLTDVNTVNICVHLWLKGSLALFDSWEVPPLILRWAGDVGVRVFSQESSLGCGRSELQDSNAQIPFSNNLAAHWASIWVLENLEKSQIRGDDVCDSYVVPAVTSMLEQLWNLWRRLQMMIWCWHSSEIHKETFKLELHWDGFAALSILQSRTAAGIQHPSCLW